jgi:hypothetical protein
MDLNSSVVEIYFKITPSFEVPFHYFIQRRTPTL